MFSRGWTVLLLAVALTHLYSPAQADEPRAATLAALRQNAAALASFELQYTRTRAAGLPEEEFMRTLIRGWRPGDRAFLEPGTTAVKYARGKCHIRHEFPVTELAVGPDGKTYHASGTSQMTVDTLFDGKIYYHGNHDSRDANLVFDHIEDPAQSAFRNFRPHEPYFEAELLEYAAFHLPRCYAEFAEPELTSLPLHLIAGGATAIERTDAESNRVTLELELDSERYLFELDPAKHYAVVRQEHWSQGLRKYASELSEFQPVGNGGVVFPHQAVVAHDQWPPRFVGAREKPVLIETYVVTSLHERPIAAREFREDVLAVYKKPGTYVSDGTLPGASERRAGQVSYIVPDNSAQLAPTVIAAVAKGTSFPWRSLAIAVGIVALVGSLGVVLHFLTRRSSGEKIGNGE